MAPLAPRPGAGSAGWPASPLPPLVQLQVAVVAVFGSHIVGIIIQLCAAGLEVLVRRDLFRGLDARVVFWVAVCVGALVTTHVTPMVWHAARRVPMIRRLQACVCGSVAADLLIFGAYLLGAMPAVGPTNLVELLTVVACGLAGAGVAWGILGRPTTARTVGE